MMLYKPYLNGPDLRNENDVLKSAYSMGFFGKEKERRLSIKISVLFLVGATGFEPAAFWSRTKRATKLRYAPAGANVGIRTLDLRITNALLYRLSYIGVPRLRIIAYKNNFVTTFLHKKVFKKSIDIDVTS